MCITFVCETVSDMSNRYALILLPVVIVTLFISCNNKPSKSHGPIVLGDSSTIVTEKDPRKLTDLVTDLQPDIPPTPNPDSAGKGKPEDNKQSTKDSAKAVATTTVSEQGLPDVGGLKAEFKDFSLLIPNITAKLAGNPNLLNATGAVYTLLSGTLDGNTIRTTGNITKVSQKYQAVVMVKNKLGTLPLETLSNTTDWETVKGGKSAYPITGLDNESLSYPKVNNSAIRNAVVKAANRRRLSHKKMQEWLNSVGNVHSANQKPLIIVLRSVMWKIEGKDDKGKTFSKQIRIDIPL